MTHIGALETGQPLVMRSTGVARPNEVKHHPFDGPVVPKQNYYFDTHACAVPPASMYGDGSPPAHNHRSP